MNIIIVGGGQVGSYLAPILISNGHGVCIIEKSEEVYRKLIRQMPNGKIYYGNGSDTELLIKAGITSADVVAAVTGADEINLVVSTLAKMEFGVPRVVARVNNPKNTWLYSPQMGVDVCVNQSDIIAHLIVEDMDLKNVVTLLKLSIGDYSIVQVRVGEKSDATDKMIKELNLPKNTVLIAITRGDNVIIPKGDTKLICDDEIMALSDEESRKVLQRMF